MKRKKIGFKIFTFFIFTTAWSFFASLSVCAEDIDYIAPIIEGLPDSIRDKLPEDSPIDAVANGELGFGFVSEVIKESASEALLSSGDLFSLLLGTVLISSAATLHFSDVMGGKGRETVSLISSLSAGILILTEEISRADDIVLYGEGISAFVGTLAPALSLINAASANSTTAAVTSSGFLLFSSAVEFITTFIFTPLYKCSLAIAVVAAVTPTEGGTEPLSAFLRRTFTTLISAAALIYVTVLSYQTSLAAATDSVAARSVKFAVSSSIPIVGGVLSDTVRTLASGLSVIRGGAGVIGIAAVIALTVPILIKLFISGTVYGIMAFISELLGCKRESRLFSSVRSSLGLAAATVSVTAIVFIISSAIFMKTAPAISP